MGTRSSGSGMKTYNVPSSFPPRTTSRRAKFKLTRPGRLIPFCSQGSHHRSKHQTAIFGDQAPRTEHYPCVSRFACRYCSPLPRAQIYNYKIVECVLELQWHTQMEFKFRNARVIEKACTVVRTPSIKSSLREARRRYFNCFSTYTASRWNWMSFNVWGLMGMEGGSMQINLKATPQESRAKTISSKCMQSKFIFFVHKKKLRGRGSEELWMAGFLINAITS